MSILDRFKIGIATLASVASITYGVYLDYQVQDYSKMIGSVPGVVIERDFRSRTPIVKNFRALPDTLKEDIMNYYAGADRNVTNGILLGYLGLLGIAGTCMYVSSKR